jgi:hypothetical protein
MPSKRGASSLTLTPCGSTGLCPEDDAMVAKRRSRGQGKKSNTSSIGLERTNSWLSTYGQMRRNTDRKVSHRLSQLALAIAVVLTAKVIDWRNRWSLELSPIR